MRRSLTFTLSSLPPSVNACYAPRAGGGGMHATFALRRWKKAAVAELATQISGVRPVFPGAVTIEALLPDRPNRDADNNGKALCDALVKAGVIVDDRGKYVRSVSFRWADDDLACVRVTVTEQDYARKPTPTSKLTWEQLEVQKKLGVVIPAHKIHF